MTSTNQTELSPSISIGAYPVHEYKLRLGGREWTVVHTGEVLSDADEQAFLSAQVDGHKPPYGVLLWPASVALAHDVAGRADDMAGKRVLEIGAGTGLPGIVAGTLGASVMQTERQRLSLSICKRNGERNGLTTVDYRLADWTNWPVDERFDWILGSDILYSVNLHPHLERIFDANLADGGRILLSDPFRGTSLGLLHQMEAKGWRVTLSKWTVGEVGSPRPFGVYELSRPAAAAPLLVP